MSGVQKMFQHSSKGTVVITNEDLRKNGVKDNQKVAVASGYPNQEKGKVASAFGNQQGKQK